MNNSVQSEVESEKQPGPICSLLLVEDEPNTRKITAQNLLALGYAVDVAKDGTEAIALAQANDYTMVLLDITLPDMNGLDVMREIRALKGEDIIFIALSSHASEEKEDYFLRQGMMRLVVKPVSSENLKNVLDAALEVKASLDQGA
jgi:two-component system aerobic respiration control sensor histidine kinase ArcB